MHHVPLHQDEGGAPSVKHSVTIHTNMSVFVCFEGIPIRTLPKRKKKSSVTFVLFILPLDLAHSHSASGINTNYSMCLL